MHQDVNGMTNVKQIIYNELFSKSNYCCFFKLPIKSSVHIHIKNCGCLLIYTIIGSSSVCDDKNCKYQSRHALPLVVSVLHQYANNSTWNYFIIRVSSFFGLCIIMGSIQGSCHPSNTSYLMIEGEAKIEDEKPKYLITSS